MTDLWQKLKTLGRPVILYGMGDGAVRVTDRLSKENIAVAGVMASDGFVRGQSFLGHTVRRFADIQKEFENPVVLICFGSELPKVIDGIRAIPCEKYYPCLPVIGDGCFDAAFYNLHLKELSTAKAALSDDLSRALFDTAVNFALYGEEKYLFENLSTEEQIFDLLNLSNGERFLDLGAYKGDTAMRFISSVNGYQSVTAVEPDVRTYKKLCLAFENQKNFTAVNAAVADRVGETDFYCGGGRSSRTASSGKKVEKIPQITVDSLCTPFTYIKMDVEGNEKAAIEGARQTIAAHRPKMKIACYHRVEDIYDIILTVRAIRPDYKVYLRRTGCIPFWNFDCIF
ncbi:MAG: FkbM family methyltransferase, partial [Oscillospiraceae bacterium]|nr:FkbM family methyltransferase [Candidatus Equicaccousia limihippi]